MDIIKSSKVHAFKEICRFCYECSSDSIAVEIVYQARPSLAFPKSERVQLDRLQLNIPTFSVLAVLDSIPCHWDLSGNGDVDLVSGQGHTNMVCSIIAMPDKLYSLGLDKSFRTIQAATNEFWLVLENFQRRMEASTIMVKRLTKWIIGGIQPCSQAFAVSIPRLPAWE